MSAVERLSNALFHFSLGDPNEFMRSPTLHAGTAGSAVMRGSGQSGATGGIYALSKQNLDIDDLGLDDDVANLADMIFLRSRNFPVSRSVKDSVFGGTKDDIGDTLKLYSQRERTQAMRGYQSLVNNRAFTYHNNQEGGLSVVMPSPQFNTHILNNGLPLTKGQAVTTSYRELRKGRENMDWGDFDDEDVPSPKEDRESFIRDLNTIDVNTARQTWDGPGGPLPRKEFRTPQRQPSLPMDWSNVNPSDKTVNLRGY